MPYKNPEAKKANSRKIYGQNKELIKARSKAYYQANVEKVKETSRRSHLRNTYGLTGDQYLQMVLDQDNCCAICRQPEHRITKTGDIKPLSVDHNHTTGAVRALLCNDCNAMLGFACEDIERIQNAIIYLQSF